MGLGLSFFFCVILLSSSVCDIYSYLDLSWLPPSVFPSPDEEPVNPFETSSILTSFLLNPLIIIIFL